MTEKVEYKVRLQGSDGQDYVISYEGLRQKLGFGGLWSNVQSLWRKIDKLEEAFVENILVPKMEEKILGVIRENPEIKTRDLNNHMPWNDLERLAWYRAFDSLKETGRIVGTSHGGDRIARGG